MVAEVYAGGGDIGPYNHDERMAPNCVTVAAKAIADVRRIKGAVLLDSHAARAGWIEEAPETARDRDMYRIKIRPEAREDHSSQTRAFRRNLY